MELKLKRERFCQLDVSHSFKYLRFLEILEFVRCSIEMSDNELNSYLIFLERDGSPSDYAISI